MKQLRYQPCSETEAAHLDVNPKFAGYKIPYFDLNGKPTSFFRYRYLQVQPSSGWGALAAPPRKPLKYSQPVGTSCNVYLPPILPVAWKEIAAQPEQPLVITEGEKKAACACSIGAYTLGLGGVYNWRSARNGWELLPILEQFAWKERDVIICFDSDVRTNYMVRSAMIHLARVLVQRGARVRAVELPDDPARTATNEAGETVPLKVGLDDFIVAHGAEAFVALLGAAPPLAVSEELHKMNALVAWINATDEVVELATAKVMERTNFVEGAYKPYTFAEPPRKEGGSLSIRHTAKEWVAWRYRHVVGKLTYEPGETVPITSQGDYNLWKGWGVEPRKGSVAAWEDFVGYVMDGLKPEQLLWLKQWFAYPIRHPGTKLHTAVLVWGPPGVGKSLLGETMERLYGKDNFQSIETADLLSQYNDYMVHKQFVVGNEVSTTDKRIITDKLKNVVTRSRATVNLKFRRQYTIVDCVNYYFTSNHCNAFFLEDRDRRYFVHEAPGVRPDAFYARYAQWLDHEGGAAFLLHHFREVINLDTFNPKAAAPLTRSKVAMIDDGKGDLELWCSQLKRDGVVLSRSTNSTTAQPYQFYTSRELLAAFKNDSQDDSRRSVTENGLTRAMKSVGFHQLAHGESLDLQGNGRRERVWALREEYKYLTAKGALVRASYLQERTQFPPRPVGGKANAGRSVKNRVQ